MNIQHLLLFATAALFDGNNGLVNAKPKIYTQMEGQDLRIQMDFKAPTQSRKYLCRNNCTREDILIETHGNRFNSGRYIIRYDTNDNRVYAVITGLTRSDAGRYKVGVSVSSSFGFHQDFEIQVRDLCDAVSSGEPKVYRVTEGENITITCSLFSHPRNRKFLYREESNKFLADTNDMKASSERYNFRYESSAVFYVTIAKLTASDSGRYRCGVGRQNATNTCQEFEIAVKGGNFWLLFVCLPVGFVLLVICSLLLYKWRMRKVDYVNTRENGRNAETSIYDDCAAVSMHEGPIYQDLDHNSREHHQYCSLSM